MNIVFYIPTYNRPEVLHKCLETVFNSTTKPNEIWIIDDGSEIKLKSDLFTLSLNKSIPINLIMHGKNYGISYTFERIHNLIRQSDDLDIACILESDYVWKKNWLEDVLAVFKASPETIAIAGTDHPDMYDKHKSYVQFPEIMIKHFGKDLESRKNLYIPFNISTELGDIKVQGVSNSCGCMMIHWKRFKNIIKTLEINQTIPINDYWNKMNKAFFKDVPNRKYADDGLMSSIISMYGELYLKSQNKDISKNFPMISICDYSLSQHICGGGINGQSIPEGMTFIVSPTWKNEYIHNDSRKNE